MSLIFRFFITYYHLLADSIFINYNQPAALILLDMIVSCGSYTFALLSSERKTLFYVMLIQGVVMALLELSDHELSSVSGGNANSNYERNTGDKKGEKSNYNARGSSSGFYSSRVNSVNNFNNGIIGGRFAGSPGGVPGLVASLVGGAVAGGCFHNGNGNGGGSGTSPAALILPAHGKVASMHHENHIN